MSRVERLLNLTAALLDTDRPLTREELAERVPGYGEEGAAARRAFERDKETLRELGIPIELEPIDPATPGSPEGYRVLKSAYYLPDPGLEADELAALHLAASTVRLPGTRGVEALWKLGGVPGEGDPPPTHAVLPGNEHLVVLFGALAERRTVAFDYRGQTRRVDPHRIAFRNGHWYVAGHDHARGGVRQFRLDRVEAKGVEAGPPGAFERPATPADGDEPPWRIGEGDPVVAHLLVDADQAGWAVAHLGAEAVAERRGDGSVVLAVHVTNRDAFRTFVLGFLDHAEVLDPPGLRQELVAWLEAQCLP